MLYISKLAEIVNGTVIGDNNLQIDGICDIENGKKNHIAYIKNNKYLKYLNSNLSSAIIIDSSINLPIDFNKTIIKVKNAQIAFISLMQFYNSKMLVSKKGIHKSSLIHESAILGEDIYIGPNVVIEENVVIGNKVKIFSGTYIGNNVEIGNNTCINSNVSIYHNVFIGNNCYIEAGTVLGSDGFGIISVDKLHHRIPHIGLLKIGNDVLIGSNCSIDRGTINDTSIGNNTKIDNMVHIAHNVVIGDSCLLCGQVGIAGSVKIGNNVTIAGKVAIIDHIVIGKNSTILTGSCVFKSIKENSLYSGNPARPHKNRVKEDIVVSKLPELYKKLFIK